MCGENKIDLSGIWRYETDLENSGIDKRFFERELNGGDFKLPGSACENGIGTAAKEYTELCAESVKCLRERFEYIGPLWLSREIDVPESFKDKRITLSLERVNMSSMLWVDGKSAGRGIIELSVPHRYDLTGLLTPGRHRLTLRLDNSNLLNIHTMASGYSNDTQGYWCGVAGRAEITAESKTHIASLQVHPRENGFDVKAVVTGTCREPNKSCEAVITLMPTAPDGRELRADTHKVRLFTSRQIVRLSYEFDEPADCWDEFNPVLYTLRASVADENGAASETETRFGMRTIEVRDKRIHINGRPVFLRGALDCAIYPKTGYPPTDVGTWLNTMNTIKAYGLNHIRFHAWCPPEAAFEAADIAGVYVLAEMPLWLNLDVCPLEAGDDAIHKTYYTNEALAISKEYGNHPSFIMFSNGNELLGDFEMLEDITSQVKALDGRRLYTLSSNFDRPVTAADDYFSAVQSNGKRIRLQTFVSEAAEDSCLNYDEAAEETPVPMVSFEIGQYCVYPNVDSIGDYDGNMSPVNLKATKCDMERRGIYHKLEKYVKASGKLAALLYKEDIEAAMRTHKMGGFQMLGLADYTGQSTATIGLLDVFWKSKGIITEEEFKKFCSPVVPLMKAKRFFCSDETLKAELDVCDYGKTPLENREFTLELYDGKTLLASRKTSGENAELPLDAVKRPTEIKAVLSVGEYKNSWNIFVYPPFEEAWDISVCDADRERLEKMIKDGGRFVVSGKYLKAPRQGYFRPVFWSPAFFKTDRACGIMCESSHPIFEKFPTRDFADFQWKQPLDNSVSADISSFPEGFLPVVETVPNFYDNVPASPLFEARVGNADILFCGFDFSAEHICVRNLKNAVLSYASSEKFAPKQAIAPEELLNLFK